MKSRLKLASLACSVGLRKRLLSSDRPSQLAEVSLAMIISQLEEVSLAMKISPLEEVSLAMIISQLEEVCLGLLALPHLLPEVVSLAEELNLRNLAAACSETRLRRAVGPCSERSQRLHNNRRRAVASHFHKPHQAADLVLHKLKVLQSSEGSHLHLREASSVAANCQPIALPVLAPTRLLEDLGSQTDSEIKLPQLGLVPSHLLALAVSQPPAASAEDSKCQRRQGSVAKAKDLPNHLAAAVAKNSRLKAFSILQNDKIRLM
jgi:hypothetical protein